MVVDVIRRHPLWLAGVVGAVVGTIIGLFLPIRAPEAGKASADEWSLPAANSVRGYNDTAAASVRQARFWGAADIAKPQPKQQWLLRAIVTRPVTRIGIAVGPTKDMVWVPLGGRLPDGTVLVAVNRDTAWTDRDGCRSPHSLYPSAAPAADPCLQDANARPVTPAASAPASTPSKTDSP